MYAYPALLKAVKRPRRIIEAQKLPHWKAVKESKQKTEPCLILFNKSVTFTLILKTVCIKYGGRLSVKLRYTD